MGKGTVTFSGKIILYLKLITELFKKYNMSSSNKSKNYKELNIWKGYTFIKLSKILQEYDCVLIIVVVTLICMLMG